MQRSGGGGDGGSGGGALLCGPRVGNTAHTRLLCGAAAPLHVTLRGGGAGYLQQDTLLLLQPSTRSPPYLLCPRGSPSGPRTLRAGWWAL
eukprot:COSAG01_NODE_6159_length_3818_cov_8.550686_1_plen_90_part_00